MSDHPPTDAAATAGAAAASPLTAFHGALLPTRTGPLYQAGLAVVAFAMVLLPLLYLALVGLASWGVVLHLRHDTWIFDTRSGRGGILQLLVYLGPAVAGFILVFFMVKPFFAAKPKPPETLTLDREQEPLLFAFVDKICGLVGAPPPCRIDVDCQVNASASLRRGLWSNDLVLTVGLPLASGLDMRQFAGVLAHEFGHFAQGAGMRLTYVIRHINHWFARVVYERDAWDIKLDRTARGTDWRLAVVLHAARGCVWVTRRILWALMHAGHAISCFMLRQMEFDADSYEAKLSGSDTFATTASRLRILNVALQVAYEDVRQSWASNRLPENLPLLVDHKAGALPPEVHQKLNAATAEEKTRWFHTHPCDTDRTRAVQDLNEPGIFRLTEPATRLFSNFAALSKTVTRHQYEKHLELEFTEQNLMSAEELLRESAASSEADAMIRKYFGAVDMSLLPLLASGAIAPVPDSAPARADWRAAGLKMESLRAEAEKSSTGSAEQQERLAGFASAHALAKAGFQLTPKDFGLPETATSVGEQETSAQWAVDDSTSAFSARLMELQPFMEAVSQRVVVALGLAQAAAANSDAARPEAAAEAAELAPLLAAVAAQLPRARQLALKRHAFLILAQNISNHTNPPQVDRVLTQLGSELQALIGSVQASLQGFLYPFPHARGRLTVAEYARNETPVENEHQRVFMDSGAHADRLFALHYRLVGRILALASAAEKEFKLEEEIGP